MTTGYTNYDINANCIIDDSCTTDACQGSALERVEMLLCRWHQVGLLNPRCGIVADLDPPVLTLVGEAKIEVQQECGRSFQMIGASCSAGSYFDPGATAQDAVSGNVTSSITVDGTVDLTTAGVQELTYTARDEAGLTASIVRNVTVVGIGCMDSTCVDSFQLLCGFCVFVYLSPFHISMLFDQLSRCVSCAACSITTMRRRCKVTLHVCPSLSAAPNLGVRITMMVQIVDTAGSETVALECG